MRGNETFLGGIKTLSGGIGTTWEGSVPLQMGAEPLQVEAVYVLTRHWDYNILHLYKPKLVFIQTIPQMPYSIRKDDMEFRLFH